MEINKIIVLEIIAINGDRYTVKFPEINLPIEMNFAFLQQYITNANYRLVKKLSPIPVRNLKDSPRS